MINQRIENTRQLERTRIAAETQTIIGVLRTSDEKLDVEFNDSGYNVPPLEDLVEVFRAAHLPVALVREGDTSSLPPNLQAAVYRIAQESLTNALRYAQGATRVELRVSLVQDRLTVRVSDDGVGDADFEHGTGQGLVGIRERAKLLGGSASAGPGESGGWGVEVGVPVR